jgi:transposase
MASERIDMSPHNQLFLAALGLTSPWRVQRGELTAKPRLVDVAPGSGNVLEVELDFQRGSRFACPHCGELCPVHDTDTRVWRHLDFWQHRTYLQARTPRIKCPTHGVSQIALPWARADSGFTLLFEMMVMTLIADMAVSALAEHLGEHDTRLWRIVRHYVDKAHAASHWSGMSTVAIDETATRKGHRYATVVVDMDSPLVKQEGRARLIFMTPERKATCVGSFAREMSGHGSKPEDIRIAAIDMGRPYIQGVKTYLPEAQICFDRFHVMKLCGAAIDTLRKDLQREGCDLKGARWALRGNVENLSTKQAEVRQRLLAEHSELARAFALRDELRALWSYTAAEALSTGRSVKELGAAHLKAWCAWAQRSRLGSFVKLARSIREHADGILGYYLNRTTSAAIESINGIIQTARRRARGFRNFANLRAIAYWSAGLLTLPSPTHSK